nr:immunoglobulin light chain junction region [Macaca mulatta]MOW16332.1 immunoglobulin light chain junction region [Macaca mulatta]MOW16676.1 immunoglobulin light chain junction region [Macaca mulatta]
DYYCGLYRSGATFVF